MILVTRSLNNVHVWCQDGERSSWTGNFWCGENNEGGSSDCGMLHAVKYPTWTKPPRWQIARFSRQTFILGVYCMKFMFLHSVMSAVGCAVQRVCEEVQEERAAGRHETPSAQTLKVQSLQIEASIEESNFTSRGFRLLTTRRLTTAANQSYVCRPKDHTNNQSPDWLFSSI